MASQFIREEKQRLLRTGHELFDYIFTVHYGSAILMLDKTFSEAYQVLNLLMKNYAAHLAEPLELKATYSRPADRYSVDMNSTLSDISILVNQIRRENKGRVIFHLYLPSLLIRHSLDEVLKLLESWNNSTKMNETIEFYFLSKGAFPDFEGRVMPIVDGVIEISIVERDSHPITLFKPIRICREEFHLKNFEYKIQSGRLLIKWEDEYTDSLPSDKDKIDETLQKIRTHEISLQVKKGVVPVYGLPAHDQLWVSQLIDRNLAQLRSIFPEQWVSLSYKIASLVAKGYLRLEYGEPDRHIEEKEKLGFANRLMLRLPLSVAYFLVHLRRKALRRRVRTVPLDAHLSLKEAAEALTNVFTRDDPSSKEVLDYAARFFSEIASRRTAREYIKMLEGSDLVRFDKKHLPKLVGLTLMAGFNVRAAVRQQGPRTYRVVVKGCYLCEGVKSKEPYCDNFLSGVIKGSMAVCYKERISCREVACKAMGDENCEFLLFFED